MPRESLMFQGERQVESRLYAFSGTKKRPHFFIILLFGAAMLLCNPAIADNVVSHPATGSSSVEKSHPVTVEKGVMVLRGNIPQSPEALTQPGPIASPTFLPQPDRIDRALDPSGLDQRHDTSNRDSEKDNRYDGIGKDTRYDATGFDQNFDPSGHSRDKKSQSSSSRR